jgi:DUF4097 and DUF4098 domain-containing protein YvlB
MAGYPPPYPPPGPPFGQGPYSADWKYQRRILRDQARAQRELFKAQRAAYRQQYRGMRRGSIVGPLLVIAVGVIFLLVQLGKLSSSTVWTLYGRWWPLLLVAAGMIALLEWALDQFLHRDDTQPHLRRTLGGGVIWLFILFALAGIAVQGIHSNGTPFNFHIDQDDLDQFMGDKHESDQTLVQPFPAEGSLEVDNPRGDVTISGTSDDNQIHIMLHKEVYSSSDSDAASKASQLSPELTSNGGHVQLRLPVLEGARADLIITVPVSTRNSVTANHGDVHVSGLRGPLNITANHGDVELSAITGSVNTHIQNSGSDFSAHSVTGSVTLEGKGHGITISDITGPVAISGDYFGDTHVEHVRGGVGFHTSRTNFQLARLDGEIDISSEEDLSADQAVGPVILTTRNRNITFDRIAGDVSVTNRNGKVDITSAPPLGNVTVENRNGSVDLTLPDQAAFHVQAETSDGEMENDFSLPLSGNDNHKAIMGTVGNGSASIKITTSQGDVSLKRASIAPLPSEPPALPALTALPAEAQRAINNARHATDEAKAAAAKAKRDTAKAKDEGANP